MAPDAFDVHEAIVVIEERLADLEAALSAERLEVQRLKRAARPASVPEADRILGREPYLEARSNGELEPGPVGSIPSPAAWRVSSNPDAEPVELVDGRRVPPRRRQPASTNAELLDENEALRDETRRFELDRDGWRARCSALEAQVRDLGDDLMAAAAASEVRAARVAELEAELALDPGKTLVATAALEELGRALRGLELTPVGDLAILRNAIAVVRRAFEALA